MKSQTYAPDFSRSGDICIHCVQAMSAHEYVSGEFHCETQTKQAMTDIMKTVADCEQRWQFDLNHGWLYAAEATAARHQFEQEHTS